MESTSKAEKRGQQKLGGVSDANPKKGCPNPIVQCPTRKYNAQPTKIVQPPTDVAEGTRELWLASKYDP